MSKYPWEDIETSNNNTKKKGKTYAWEDMDEEDIYTPNPVNHTKGFEEQSKGTQSVVPSPVSFIPSTLRKVNNMHPLSDEENNTPVITSPISQQRNNLIEKNNYIASQDKFDSGLTAHDKTQIGGNPLADPLRKYDYAFPGSENNKVTVPENKDASWGKVLGNNLRIGVNQFDIGTYQGIRMLNRLLGPLGGEDEPLRKDIEEMEQENSQLQSELKDTTGVKKFVGTGLEGATAMVPTALGGKALGSAAKGTGVVSNLLKGAGAKSMLFSKIAPKVGQFLVKSAEMTPFFVNSLGMYSREAEADGANEEQQLLYGLTGATIETVTEAPIFTRWLDGTGSFLSKKLIKSGVKSTVKVLGATALDYMFNTLGEGFQEAITDPMTYAAKKAIYDPDAKWENTMGQSFYGGVAMSVLMSAAGLPGTAANYRAMTILENNKKPTGKDIQEVAELTNQDSQKFVDIPNVGTAEILNNDGNVVTLKNTDTGKEFNMSKVILENTSETLATDFELDEAAVSAIDELMPYVGKMANKENVTNSVDNVDNSNVNAQQQVATEDEAKLNDYYSNVEGMDYANSLDPEYVKAENELRSKHNMEPLTEVKTQTIETPREPFVQSRVTTKKEVKPQWSTKENFKGTTQFSDEEKAYKNMLDKSGVSADDYIADLKGQIAKKEDEQISYLRTSGGKGYEDGGVVKDESGNVTFRYGRVSNNPGWYQDFYKKNGRKPNVSELRELAQKHLTEGYQTDTMEVPADEEYINLKKQLETMENVKNKAEHPQQIYRTKKEPIEGSKAGYKNTVVDEGTYRKNLPPKKKTVEWVEPYTESSKEGETVEDNKPSRVETKEQTGTGSTLHDNKEQNVETVGGRTRELLGNQKIKNAFREGIQDIEKKSGAKVNAKIIKPKTEGQKALADLGKTLGVEVVFYDSDSKFNEDGFTAPSNSDVVFVRKGTTTKLTWTFGHEFYHTLKTNHNKLFKQTFDTWKGTVTKEQIKAYRAEIAKNNAAYEKSLSDDAIIEEMFADEMGNSFTHKDFWKKIYDKSKEVFDKLVNVVKSLFTEARRKSYNNYLVDNQIKGLQMEFEKVVSAIVSGNEEINFSPDSDDLRTEVYSARSKGERDEEYPKDLIAIHNISEEKLEKAFELGGLPVPSIAVTKKDVPFSAFGNISLVGDRTLVDPELTSTNKVFNTDVYSRRMPNEKEKVNKNAMHEIISKVKNSFSDTDQYLYNIQDYIERGSFEDAVDKFRDNLGMKLQYLRDIGQDIKIPMRDEKLKGEYSKSGLEMLKQFIKENPKFNETDYFYAHEEEFNKKLYPILKQDIESFDREYFSNLSSEQLQLMIDTDIKNISNSDRTKLNIGTLEDVRKDIYKISNPKKVVDTTKLKEVIKSKFKTKKIIAEYRTWLNDLFSPAFGDKYFEVGNKKIPYNIDSVYDYMQGRIKGTENFYEGPGTAKARGAKQFSSIYDMHRHSNTIKTEEDVETFKKSWGKKNDTVMANIHSRHKYPDGYTVFDDYYVAMGDYLSGKRSAANALSANEFKNVPSELVEQFKDVADDLKNAPVNYFEAKPQRIVNFNDFKAALVPKGVSKELVEKLKNYGLKIVKYEEYNDNSRQEAIDKIKNVAFSARNKEERSELDIVSPEGFTMPYRKNLQKSAYMGDMFAQDIEPSGDYINYAGNDMTELPNHEYGNITFKKPLIMEYETSGPGGWKTKLSEKYNGKTGKALSRAIMKDGYDSVVTVDHDNNEIREIVNLSAERQKKEPIFYKGSNADDNRRISTGNPDWDNNIFMADNEKDAKLYGKNIEKIKFKEGSKILYEGTKEFKNLKVNWNRNESMLDWGKKVIKKAKEQGYDAVHFERQGEIGTVVMNPDSLIRNYNNQTDTPEFKRWFGNSKVTDLTGKPLRVFHATTKDFTTFKTSFAPGWGTGIYFSDNPETLNEYSDGQGGNVIPAYLKIEKPFDGTYPGDKVLENTKAWEKYKYNENTEEGYSSVDDAWQEEPNFVNSAIKELGYDGIIADNSNGIEGKEIVVFSPTQVKSAIGNNGKFDINNPDIRYSSRDKEERQTDTPQFKAWFKDSKVVDEQGNPKIVYHGTDNEFNTFKTSNMWGYGGTYFTTSEKVANQYTRNGKVVAAYVSLRNPYIVDAQGRRYDSIARPDEIKGRGYVDTQEIVAYARNNNYDGVIVKDVIENGGMADDIIAFSPNQIKSATGNNGDFSPENPDIRFSARTKQLREEYDKINPFKDDPELFRKVHNELKVSLTEDLKGVTSAAVYNPHNSEQMVIVSPSLKGHEYQVTTFLRNEPMSDGQYDSMDEVVKRLMEDGFTDVGETAYSSRNMEERKEDPELRRWVHNSTFNSEFTPDEVKRLIMKNMYDLTTYIRKHNDPVNAWAEEYVASHLEDAIKRVNSVSALDSAETSALAIAVYVKYVNEGRFEDAAAWQTKVAPKATASGQAIQILSTLRKLTKEGIVKHATRVIDSALTDQNKKDLDNKSVDVADKMNGVNKDAVDGVIDDLNKTNPDELQRRAKDAAKGKIPERQQRRDNKSPEEMLARRVANWMMPGHINRNDPIKVMVETLFKVAKKTLPEKELSTKNNPIDFINAAMREKEQYLETWQKAQELVKEQFKEQPETLKELDDYFETFLTKPFADEQMSAAVKKGLKDLKIDLAALVKKHYTDVNAAQISLADKLISKGLDEQSAKELEIYISLKFQQLTGEKKAQILKNMFKEHKKPVRQSYIDKIIELSNLGAYAEKYRPYVAKKLGIPSLSPELAQKLYEQADRIQGMEEGIEKARATCLMLKDIYEELPVPFLQKVATIQAMAQLLGLKTTLRNIIGNTLMLVAEEKKNIIMTPVDMLIYKGIPHVIKGTGKRTTGLPMPQVLLPTMHKSFKISVKDATLGIDTFEDADKRDLPRPNTFKKGPLKYAQIALNIALHSTDVASKQGIIAESLAQQQKWNKVEEPTEDMIKIAKGIADYTTFADTNFLSYMSMEIKKAFNSAIPTRDANGKLKMQPLEFGFGNMINNYPKVPANLVARAIDYSPVGFAKAVLDLASPLLHQLSGGRMGKEFNQKKFVDDLGRGIVGTADGILLGIGLAALGIITGDPDDDKDKRELERLIGIGQYKFNVSGLGRFVLSGFNRDAAKLKEGDTLLSYDWIQPFAINLSIGANFYKNRNADKTTQEKTVSTATLAIEALNEGVDALTNQPVTKGLKNFFQYGDIGKSMINTVEAMPASFIPSTLNRFKQMTDNTTRETYDPNVKPMIANTIKAKIPGLSKSVNPAIDVWGNIKEYMQNGSNNFFNVYIDPAITTKYEPTKESELALNIYKRIGEKVQFPKVAPKKFDRTVKKETKHIILTAKEYVFYQRNLGKFTKKLYEEYADSYSESMSDKEVRELSSNLQNGIKDINAQVQDEILRRRGWEETDGILQPKK